MTERIVAIVGFAPETRELCNIEPPSTELWGMNVGNSFMKRQDRWFQMHPLTWHEGSKTKEEDRGCYGRGQDHIKFLSTCGVPVYQQAIDDRIPTSVLYDVDAVWKDIAPSINRGPYMTSTPAYALAQAISEEVSEIKLFGLNLSANIEYIQQRPCLEFLLGIAQGRGIKVTIPQGSPLLQGALYARDSILEDKDVAQERLDGWRDRYYSEWANWYVAAGAIRENVTWQENSDRMFCKKDAERAKQVAEHRGKAMGEHMERVARQIEYIGGGRREALAWLTRFGGVDLRSGNMPGILMPPGIKNPGEIWTHDGGPTDTTEPVDTERTDVPGSS